MGNRVKYVGYYSAPSGCRENLNTVFKMQRAKVVAYVDGRGKLIDEFVETKSEHLSRRIHLKAAITAARRHRAILVIARFAHLIRDTQFIRDLRDSNVDFIVLDIPEVDRSTIHVLAAVAGQERVMHSERTKAALQAAKMRGVRLGNPNPFLAQKQASEAAKQAAKRVREAVWPIIKELHQEGLTLRAIADELNRGQIPTARGRQWHASSVRNILTRSA